MRMPFFDGLQIIDKIGFIGFSCMQSQVKFLSFSYSLYKWQLQYGAIRDRSKRLEYLKKIVRSSEASPAARQATMTGIHVRSDRAT